MNSRITRIKKTTDSAVYKVVDSKGYRYIIKVFYRINRYRDELTYLEMMGDDINTIPAIQNEAFVNEIMKEYKDETNFQYWSIVYPFGGSSLKLIKSYCLESEYDVKSWLLQIFNIAYTLTMQKISYQDFHPGNILIQDAKSLMSSNGSIQIRYTYQNEISFEFVTRNVLKLIDFERSSTLQTLRNNSRSSSNERTTKYSDVNFSQISYYCLRLIQCTELNNHSLVLPFLNANTLERIQHFFSLFITHKSKGVELLPNSVTQLIEPNGRQVWTSDAPRYPRKNPSQSFLNAYHLPTMNRKHHIYSTRINIDYYSSSSFCLALTTTTKGIGVFYIESTKLEKDTFITKIGSCYFPQPHADFGQFIQSNNSNNNCIIRRDKVFTTQIISPYDELFI